jgi:hypothetical protein
MKRCVIKSSLQDFIFDHIIGQIRRLFQSWLLDQVPPLTLGENINLFRS